MKNATIYTTTIEGIDARICNLMKEVRKQVIYELPLTCNVNTINQIEKIAGHFKALVSHAAIHECTVEEVLIAQQWDSVDHWLQVNCEMKGQLQNIELIKSILVGSN